MPNAVKGKTVCAIERSQISTKLLTTFNTLAFVRLTWPASMQYTVDVVCRFLSFLEVVLWQAKSSPCSSKFNAEEHIDVSTCPHGHVGTKKSPLHSCYSELVATMKWLTRRWA